MGGTKGIGLSVARALARSGASVSIVGRSGGDAVVEAMAAEAIEGQDFAFLSADLSTVAGSEALAAEVRSRGVPLDFVVFTVGVPVWCFQRSTHFQIHRRVLQRLSVFVVECTSR